MTKINKRNLTIAFAKSVELPAARDLIYRDLKTPSLGLRVYASGKKTWIFQKKLGQKTIKLTLGDILNLPLESTYNPKTGENIKGARQLANEAALMINQGKDPRLEKAEQIKITKSKMTKQSLTIRVIWDEYIEHKLAIKTKPVKQRTIQDWNNARLKLGNSAFWHQPASELTGLKLADEIKRQTKLAKSVTARNGGMTQASLTLRYLKAAYRYAVVAHKLEQSLAFKELDDLFPGWNTTKASTRRIGESEGELRIWWNAVDELREKEKPDAIAIADWLQLTLFFGTRKQELLSLEWKSVDLNNNFILLPDHSTKSGRNHLIPLTRHVRSILERRFIENEARNHIKRDGTYIGKSSWVFPSSRKGSHTKKLSHLTSPYTSIRKIKVATGIDFSPHDLRRTFATLLNESGVSNITIEKALNHAPTTTVAKSYLNNPRLSKLRETYQSLEDSILKEVGVINAEVETIEISKDEYLKFLKYKELN